MVWIFAVGAMGVLVATVLVTALATAGVIAAAWDAGWRTTNPKCPHAVETWRGRAWGRGVSARQDRMAREVAEAAARHLADHLGAIAGAEQPMVARRGVPAPAPGLALLMAENCYLLRSGWTRMPERDQAYGEAWSPSWDATAAYERTRALAHQRQRDRDHVLVPRLRGA